MDSADKGTAGGVRSYPISVVIIAQDDEVRIAGAIESCRPFADDIVVVDGGSRDGTVEVAAGLGCRVFENPWPGYAKQREFGVERAAHDWVFLIDTDEAVSNELVESILELKPRLSDRSAAYAVYRIGDFLGRWLDRGEYLVRLYNRKQYGIRDSLVHEMPEVAEDSTVQLEGTLWHHGFRSINDHVNRFNRYTDLEAETAMEQGRSFKLSRLLLRPPARFMQRYFLHGLFRKGVAGFAVAVFWMMYEFMAAFKHYEKDRVKRQGAGTAVSKVKAAEKTSGQLETPLPAGEKGERGYAVQ